MRRADSDDVSFGAPIITIYLPVWDKDHSITLVPFNDRYQKVLKKTLDYMESLVYCASKKEIA